MPFLFATRPLGVARLLDRVLMLTRATFLPVLPIAGVQVLASVAGDALRWEYFTGTLGHGYDWSAIALLPPIGLLSFGLTGVFVIATAAVICRFYEVATGTPSPSTAWRTAAGRAPALVGANVLSALPALVFGNLIIWRLLTMMLGRLPAGTPDSGAGPGLETLCILAIVVCVPWFIRTFLLAPEVLINRAGPVEAIRASWRLTRGHALRVSGVLLFVLLAALLWVTVALVLTHSIVAAFGIGAEARDGAALAALRVFSFPVLMPLLTACQLCLWHDLKLRAGLAVPERQPGDVVEPAP